MYLEKNEVIKKLTEFCDIKGIQLTYEQKSFVASQTLRKLDNERLLSFEEFIDLLEHNERVEEYSDIDFNDEIVSIEELDEIEMVDFDVTGDHLFHADGILTHNSATNNVDDADNSNVSDSMGTVMTADFMMFLLQNEEMKEKKEIVCKVTKNRFGGRTDTWMMNVDYNHMRFSDMLIQSNAPDMDVSIINNSPSFTEDFGIVTAEKLSDADDFATNEIKAIAREDHEKAKSPFASNLDEIYKDLGL